MNIRRYANKPIKNETRGKEEQDDNTLRMSDTNKLFQLPESRFHYIAGTESRLR